jgi:Transcriptional regulators
MRCICCTARVWSLKAAAGDLKSPSSIPRASASSTRYEAPIDALAARLAAARAGTDAAGRARLDAALAAGRRIDRNTTLAELIALDVDFHRAIYQLAGNPVIEETIAPQWPHMRRSMATVLSELDYRDSAWAEHADIPPLHSRRRRERSRARGAGACADGGTDDRGEIEGDGRGGGLAAGAFMPGLVPGIHVLS